MSEPDIQACPIRRSGPPDWAYTCADCGAEFTMPAAAGPSEEKRRVCPECGGRNITHEVTTAEPCAPGG